jgi:hypothetical protein
VTRNPGKGLAVLVLLILSCACTHRVPARATNPAPTLVPTGDISGNFLMRQHLAFESDDDRGSFEALVQKHCDELIVVGMTPFGSRAFTLRQRGVDVEIQTHVDLEWPFPPIRILLDVHRVYLLPLANPPPGDGVHDSRFGNEIVSERWRDGILEERRFRRDDGTPPQEVVVTYEDGASLDHPPIRVRVENRRFGYVLDATSIERRPLSCP